MEPSSKKKTRYQEIKETIEDNSLLSIGMLIVVVFIGLGAIAGAYNNIRAALPPRPPAPLTETSAGLPGTGATASLPQATDTQPEAADTQPPAVETEPSASDTPPPALTQEPPASAATAIPANAPLDPNLEGEWFGQTSNGGTLHFTLKQKPQAGGTLTLQADIPLPQGCSLDSDRFREKIELGFDPTLNRLTGQSDKIVFSGEAGGNPQNRTLTGQMTIFVQDFSGKAACTQVQVGWSAQKAP